MIAVEKTVGEIAREIPSAVRVFEKHGIDYCCGGRTPLEQACGERGLAVERLVADLEAAASPSAAAERDWNAAPLAELTDHIVKTHHAYLRTELPRLDEMLGKVLDAHGAKYAYLSRLRDVFDGLCDELGSHMMKEEMVLFPSIVRLEMARRAGSPPPPTPFGSFRNPIGMMEFEHDSAAQALGQMRELSSDYSAPDDACNTFLALYQGLAELETDLHRHIHKENNILHPRAIELESL